MNELKLFSYNGSQVRTIELNGEPWFVLRDVCGVLGLDSPHKVAKRLDEDEKGRNSIPTLGGSQEMTVISESGLYNVILRSDKPEAKPFRKWVTTEVLPSIRRNGGYICNAEELIAKTATAVVAEVMKQILPLAVRSETAPQTANLQLDLSKYKRKENFQGCKIEGADAALRR